MHSPTRALAINGPQSLKTKGQLRILHPELANGLSLLELFHAISFGFAFTQLAGQTGSGPDGHGWVLQRTNAPSLAGIGIRRIPGDLKMPAMGAMKLDLAHTAGPAGSG